MIVECPQCPAKLNLADNVQGKLVRCPRCKEVFRATADMFQPDAPADIPPAPEPADDVDAPGGGWGYVEERRKPEKVPEPEPAPPPKPLSERETAEQVAQRYMHRAGIVMLAAAVLTTVNFAFNVSEVIQTRLHLHEKMRERGFRWEAGPASGPCLPTGCTTVVVGPILLCLYIGGRNMLRIGSRGMMITGIVFHILLALVLGSAVILAQFAEILAIVPLPTLVLNAFSATLNLAAATLAIHALLSNEVANVYQLRQGAEEGEPEENEGSDEPDPSAEEEEAPQAVADENYRLLVVAAKRQTRLAAFAMLVASFVAIADIHLSLTHWGSTLPAPDPNNPRGQEPDFYVLGLIFLLPMVLFMFVAARGLLVLGARGGISLGIAASVFLLVVLGTGTPFHLRSFENEHLPVLAMAMPLVGVNVITCFLLVLAAVLAGVALSAPEVRQAYEPWLPK